jgi:hypothetical protein
MLVDVIFVKLTPNGPLSPLLFALALQFFGSKITFRTRNVTPMIHPTFGVDC